MRHARTLAIALAMGFVPAAFAAACGSPPSTSGSSNTTGSSATAGSGGTTGTANGGGGLLVGSGGSAMGCTTSAQCPVGLQCIGGICCASAAQACAQECCKAGSVCLFDKCVVPGKDCHTQNDCGPGEYCETALGDEGGSSSSSGSSGSGGNCFGSVALAGKCLQLPPVCDANGMPAGCVPACEYHPPPGQLDAGLKWHWGENAKIKPNAYDVWATPTVGRVFDANCDGKVNELDPPNIIFVSAAAIDVGTGLGTCCQCTNTMPTGCHRGILRMLDGQTGAEIWSLEKADAASTGFSGLSVAIGDIDGDGVMDILAVTGEGFIVMIDSKGNVKRISDKPVPGNGSPSFGWGGGLAIADMDHDGHPEIAYGSTVYTTTNNAITLAWTGAGGVGGPAITQAISTFVDLDLAPDNKLELFAGTTVYTADGKVLWTKGGADGFPGVGDFNKDGKPDAVLVSAGSVTIFDGATGNVQLGPLALPGAGEGGPPTVADFDGDGKPEIGVAQRDKYTMVKPNYVTKKIDVVWTVQNHDLSSAVTGSSVFDFEGDGKAEVIYADECFLWVYEGPTGKVRYVTPHTSFTATEASLVADVDGDGHAEIVMVSNRADPGFATGWKCLDANGQPSVVNGVTWTPSPNPNKAYGGIDVFGDKANSWVGTRTLWNEHSYHVSNICDDRDTACDAPNVYGSIPKNEKANWTLPWLNNFRQNVQDKGVFDAPDATVSLAVDCSTPIAAKASVRNIGLASLPKDVQVGIFKTTGNKAQVGATATTHQLFPGQTEVLSLNLDATASKSDSYVARIIIDPKNPTFHECNENNDQSAEVTPMCVQ